MTETTTGTTTIAEAERVERFKGDIEALKLKTGRAPREGALQTLGAVLMVAGIVMGFIGYSSSLNTDVSVKGQLDSSSYLTLAVIGVAVTVAGTGMFIRYSLAKFLRVWLLRQTLREPGEHRAAHRARLSVPTATPTRATAPATTVTTPGRSPNHAHEMTTATTGTA